MKRSPPPVPPLAERQRPGLSVTLTGVVHPNACQSCGLFVGHVRDMRRWRECDEWDQPTAVVVVLCPACAGRLIDAHARLYIAIAPNEPAPGVMGLCSLCRHRDGTRCTLARAHGGPGVVVTAAKPALALVRTAGGCRSTRLYTQPPKACSGREEIAGT